MAAAFRIQDAAMAQWPDEPIGWKIGFIAPDRRLTVEPDRLVGPIWRADCRPGGAAPVPVGIFGTGFAAVEAEFVVRLREDAPAPRGGRWTADPVTICRTFHWLDGQLVLDRLDLIVAPDGVVAILGDNSIWADNAGWKSEIKTILAEFLGEDRRAGSGTYQRPTPNTDDLDASAFSDWEQVKVPVRRERSLESVIGYLHSTSFAAPHLFGDRLTAFDDALRERPPPFAVVNGVFIDNNEFGILLGRRPT